jgi:cob(I)alamin adenosyltransferase
MTTLDKKYKWRREDYQEKTRGLLMVHTGNGKGKTTAALGLMMRAAGRGLKCCMIQFMKSRNDRYGEHESAEKLGIEVHTMGDGFTWDTKNPEQDRATARTRKTRNRTAPLRARPGISAWRNCAVVTTTCWSSMNWFTS